MTTTEKLHELIMKVTKGSLTTEQLKPGANLMNDLHLDSLALIELLVLTEHSFGIVIDRKEAQGVSTIGQMVAYVDSHKTA